MSFSSDGSVDMNLKDITSEHVCLREFLEQRCFVFGLGEWIIAVVKGGHGAVATYKQTEA